MPSRAVLFLALAVALSVPLAARAHCDTLDGPVVSSARKALESRDVAPVLAWVKPAGEKEVRAAFDRALEARDRGAASSTAAESERRFLETLVRIHRSGEGAPYTGLKPAGGGVPAAVRAADHAIETGDAGDVERPLVAAVTSGVHRRFEALKALPPPGKDVAAGRAWVAAYVDYVHHVERLDATARAEGGHGEPAADAHGDGHGDGHREVPAAAPAPTTRQEAPRAVSPPATLAVLQAAHDSDVNAQARFAAFAEQADREGYRQVATLFRAAAHAEGVRARMHGAVLQRLGAEPRASLATPRVGTTRANLLQALAHENAERAGGYPRAIEQARRDALPEAVLAFTLAHGAEVGLVQLYQEALANLDRMRAPGDALHVCETCGTVVRGAAPGRCPVSLSGPEAFTRVV